MNTAGNLPSFSPGIHTPDAKLNDLARQIAPILGMRAAPPLELRYTPGGLLLMLHDGPADAVSWAQVIGDGEVIPSGSIATVLEWNALVETGTDTDEYFDIADPERLTAPAAGVYAVGCHVFHKTNDGSNQHPVGARYQLAARRWNAAGTVSAYWAFSEMLKVSAGDGLGSQQHLPVSVTTILPMAAGDYVVFETKQDSGFDGEVATSGGVPGIKMAWIARVR